MYFLHTGEYKYQFTSPKNYSIWSDYVDKDTGTSIRNYRGTVEVEDKPSSYGEVIVTVNGREARYITNSGKLSK